MQVDRAAFTQIIERHQRAVYAVAFAITRDRALADDLTQDTFVVAWCRLDELRDPTRLAAWLCGIARNRARDALKGRRTHVETSGLVDHTTPFEALSDAQCERLVATALAGVPSVYREPLVLFYLEEQTIEDIARSLGLTPQTTNKRLSRGRQHLAERVEVLVSRRLAGRGPRRDLVPCVLAAIDVGGSASHVEPLTKGSTMLKLAVPAALAITVGSANLLVADSRTSSRPRIAPTAKAAPANATSNKSAPVAAPKPAPTTTATPAAASRAPAAPKLPSTTSPVPDCAAVGGHLAHLKLDAFSSAKHLPKGKLDAFIALRARDVAAKCVAQKWSDDRRVCLAGITDSNDELACAEDGIATPDEIAALPAELQCDAVAKHLADLVTAPGAKFDIIAKKMAKAGKPFDLDQMRVQLRTTTRDQCDELAWSVALRRCIADSKSHDDTATCW